MNNLKVGDIVVLRVSCLQNEIGTLGVVFHEYQPGDSNGVQIIFKNGEYDGFSEQEQDEFLSYITPDLENYQFKNVIKLSDDFQKGKFK